MSITRVGVGMGILLSLGMSTVLWVTAQPAHAQSTTECQAKIDALREATSTAEFTTQNTARDQTGLIGKLDSASAKLNQDKFGDARANLTSFRDKVSTLSAQGKLDPADASNLNTLADQAIGCVQDLIDTQASLTAAT
jgi:hypothetical protein